MTQPVSPGELINAVRFSSIETVKDLLARGADPNETDSADYTALMFAAGRKDYIAFARLLLDNGAVIGAKNTYGNTPLICAADADNAEMVEFLLANKAPPGDRNKLGYTAQSVAEARGYSKVARILKEAAEKRRALDAEKARAEAVHAFAAKKQAYLKNMKKTAPRSGLK